MSAEITLPSSHKNKHNNCVDKSTDKICINNGKNVLNGDLCSGDDVDTYRVNHVDCNCNVCLQNKYVQLENGKVPNLSNKGIKFGHINIHSLIGKIDEFKMMCNNVYDIICVNETLCDKTVHDSELQLHGYNILRKDRKRDGGGVALYINDAFIFKRRDDLADVNIECIWAEITPPHRSPILVCAVYNPNGKDAEFSKRLSVMLSNASIGDNEIVVLGDFNCDFTPNVNSKEVKDLKFVSDMHQLHQLITLPTRVTSHSKTIIDLFFTSKPELYENSGVIQTAISDHFMIYAIRSCKPIKGKHKTIDYRCYKKFDEEAFLDDLCNVSWKDIEKFDNVNDAVDLWQQMFSTIVDKHVPKKSKRVKAKPTPWLNRNITSHMSTRDYLHRKAIQSNEVSDWDAYKAYRNKVTGMIRRAKENYCKQSVSQCSNDSKKMWKALNEFMPSKASPSPNSIIVEDEVCNSNDAISNGFNKHFSSVASKLIDTCSSDKCNDDNVQTSSNKASTKLLLPNISSEFVSREIDHMSIKKAAGLDDISCKILKIAKPAIVHSLTYLMNMSLNTGVFPHAWKEAKIIPLHKGGDLSDTNNYRPIAILPVISKIIEKAVHKHVYSYMSEHNMISKHQSGFRPFHSTETCLVDMVNNWVHNMNAGTLTGVAFIDLRKAFDTVNHDILLRKINDLGASSVALKWFESYLSGRYQRVYFKGSLSDALPITTGVPQGSILGPLFFIIFIDSMSEVISHGKLSMYADDTTLSVNGTNVRDISDKLTSDLNAIAKWLTNNKLFLNTDKTNVMLIGTGAKLRNIENNEFSVNIDGKELDHVTKAKCLGVVIDNELRWPLSS